MKTTFLFVVLYVSIYPVRLQLILHSDVQNGEASFSSQHHGLANTDQCIENCSSQANSPIVNYLRDPSVQQGMENMPNGIFGFIHSSVSSLLDYVYRLFVQPWIGMFEYGRPVPIDRNFYAFEDRSAVDPPLTTATSVNWHDLGTTVFQVLSSLFGKNQQVQPSKLPPTFQSSESSADTTGSISAINPL